MRIKDNFVLRQVADTWCVLPLGEATLNLNGMLTLNDSGAMLWQTLEKGGSKDTLVDALLNEYDVTCEQALADVEEFIEKLRQVDCIEE